MQETAGEADDTVIDDQKKQEQDFCEAKLHEELKILRKELRNTVTKLQ